MNTTVLSFGLCSITFLGSWTPWAPNGEQYFLTLKLPPFLRVKFYFYIPGTSLEKKNGHRYFLIWFIEKGDSTLKSLETEKHQFCNLNGKSRSWIIECRRKPETDMFSELLFVRWDKLALILPWLEVTVPPLNSIIQRSQLFLRINPFIPMCISWNRRQYYLMGGGNSDQLQ